MIPTRIAQGAYRSVTLTPLAGLLQCGKYLPLRLMNSMILEFSLARTDDALVAAAGVNTSRQFELTQCELQFSTVRLDFFFFLSTRVPLLPVGGRHNQMTPLSKRASAA